MKIVKQSHKFLHYGDKLKLIEAAGRTCYKSEGKITSGSAAKFVRILARVKKHYSVLGHAHVCFEVCDKSVSDYLNETETCTKYFRMTNFNGRFLVSGNLWAWRDFFERETLNVIPKLSGWYPVDLYRILNYLNYNYPQIFEFCMGSISSPIKPFAEKDMTNEEKMVHAARTCRFITNRGITHESVRHRPWDYSQESTRYVDYVKDIQFIEPVWWESSGFSQKSIWKLAMKSSEVFYKILRFLKWKPEQARDVLPNALKTEIVATATLAEWHHMLTMRTGKAAHPQMRALMKPVLEDLKIQLPGLFDDIN